MPTTSPIRKNASVPVIKAPSGDRVLRFTITTEAIDRDGDVVIVKGLRWDEYLRNPVVLFGHNFGGLPVGKCVGIGLAADGTSVWADIEFAETKDGNEVYKLASGGFLNATSIGFRIVRASPPDNQVLSRFDPSKKCLRVIHEATLLEISLVPIPSNPEALRKAISRGLVVSKSLRDCLLQESPADDAIGRIKRKLGWNDATLSKLTVAEVKGLANAIKSEPTSDAEDEEIACSKCGKKGAECLCEPRQGRDKRPGRGGAASPADAGKPTEATPGTPSVEVKAIRPIAIRTVDDLATAIAPQVAAGLGAAVRGIVKGVAGSIVLATAVAVSEATRRRGS